MRWISLLYQRFCFFSTDRTLDRLRASPFNGFKFLRQKKVEKTFSALRTEARFRTRGTPASRAPSQPGSSPRRRASDNAGTSTLSARKALRWPFRRQQEPCAILPLFLFFSLWFLFGRLLFLLGHAGHLPLITSLCVRVLSFERAL